MCLFLLLTRGSLRVCIPRETVRETGVVTCSRNPVRISFHGDYEGQISTHLTLGLTNCSMGPQHLDPESGYWSVDSAVTRHHLTHPSRLDGSTRRTETIKDHDSRIRFMNWRNTESKGKKFYPYYRYELCLLTTFTMH